MEEDQFEEWWQDAERFVQLTLDNYALLQKTLCGVLNQLPKESCDEFFEMHPHVFWIEDYATAGAIWVTTANSKPQCVAFIFIRHDVLKRKGLRNTIAHEIAHYYGVTMQG
jgi:hypothetical protein